MNQVRHSGMASVNRLERPSAASTEVDLLVASAADRAAAAERAGGRVVVAPFDIQVGKCAVVEDPWGNELVLLDMSKGSLVTDDAGNVVGTQGGL